MNKFSKVLNFALFILALISLVACSTRPVLYPNAYYKQVGEKQANKDIDKAMEVADKTDLNSTNYGMYAGKAAGSTALGAGVGAASGAIGGAILGGGAGIGAAVGAATGAVWGLGISLWAWLFGSHQQTPIYKNYVDVYLQHEGYQVIGWK
jgi:outer membrane lipoprotein SlyB